MKRLSIITLVIILVFAITLGSCGDKANTSSDKDDAGIGTIGGSDSDDTDATAEGMEWPTDVFPADFPKYPDGTVTYVDVSEAAGIIVFIKGSNQKSYDAFKAKLEKAGWVFDDQFDDFDVAHKGFFNLTMSFEDGSVDIMLLELSTEYVEDDPGTKTDHPEIPARIEGWPKDLPFALPVYPDGDIEYDAPDPGSDSPSFGIWIKNTSKASFDSYIAAMEKDGWTASGTTGTSYYLTKDGQKVAVLLLGDNKVNINVFV